MKSLFSQINSSTPGYGILVKSGKKIILEDYRGLANLKKGTAIQSFTSFRTASITKQFTAMAIMILKERGAISFDTPISNFFPNFPDYAKKVTIRNLLTHTGGIPDHEKMLYAEIKNLKEPSMYDALRVLAQEKESLFEAGSQFLYSDAGYVLLGLIIEKITGQDYRKFLSNNIFKPLGLKNTSVMDKKEVKIKNKALGYKKTKEGWVLFDYNPLNYILGDEGVYSTPLDLSRWIEAWESNILVSKKILEEALTPFQLKNGSDGKCGFSWLIEKKGKAKIMYQTGSWVGFNNIILSDTDDYIKIIYLSNNTLLPLQQDKIKFAKKMVKEYKLYDSIERKI